LRHRFQFWAWLQGRSNKILAGKGLESPSLSQDPARLPIATLAYIGDAIYELHVRAGLVETGVLKSNELHRKAVQRVCAKAQAKKLRSLEPDLQEKERDLVRRGRNAHTGHVPKGAKVMDYRSSTALEALIGYLYLSGEWERLAEILQAVEE
jgi:ribonuclease-3 family protein